jgi:hypothetical protein
VRAVRAGEPGWGAIEPRWRMGVPSVSLAQWRERGAGRVGWRGGVGRRASNTPLIARGRDEPGTHDVAGPVDGDRATRLASFLRDRLAGSLHSVPRHLQDVRNERLVSFSLVRSAYVD